MGCYHGKYSFDQLSHLRGCLIKKLNMEGVNNVRYPPHTPKKLSWARFILLKSSSLGWIGRMAMLAILVVVAAVALQVQGDMDTALLYMACFKNNACIKICDSCRSTMHIMCLVRQNNNFPLFPICSTKQGKKARKSSTTTAWKNLKSNIPWADFSKHLFLKSRNLEQQTCSFYKTPMKSYFSVV